MQTTPKSLRLQIGIFGRRNTGKSSLLNALVNQDVAIVSAVPGTTTDPVEKPLEFRPIGPALFIDTAGLDDTADALGRQRVARTHKVLDRVDLAILLAEQWGDYEQELLNLLRARKIPFVAVAGKADLRADRQLEAAIQAAGASPVTCSATQRTGISELRQAIIRLAPEDFFAQLTITGDLVPPGGLAVLVTPIDLEAPKGRLILPQMQTIRDLLDNDAYCMVVKENALPAALQRLKTPPALVITDSQAFQQVAAVTPDDVPLTGFSILFARLKGDLAALTRGALRIGALQAGDRVLIAESCTHHPVDDDIGRVKIPRWLERHVGGKLQFDIMAGQDFPADLRAYRLIIHCGGCMFNRRLMLTRIEQARAAGVPITNYGMAIAVSLGILERALRPFPDVHALLKKPAACNQTAETPTP